jgi:hypothetical protein
MNSTIFLNMLLFSRIILIDVIHERVTSYALTWLMDWRVSSRWCGVTLARVALSVVVRLVAETAYVACPTVLPEQASHAKSFGATGDRFNRCDPSSSALSFFLLSALSLSCDPPPLVTSPSPDAVHRSPYSSKFNPLRPRRYILPCNRVEFSLTLCSGQFRVWYEICKVGCDLVWILLV